MLEVAQTDLEEVAIRSQPKDALFVLLVCFGSPFARFLAIVDPPDVEKLRVAALGQ